MNTISTTRSPAAGVVPSAPASNLLFTGFLVLLLVEYIGLASLIPILKVTRFSTLLAWSLLAITAMRLGPQIVAEHKQLRWLFGLVLLTGASVFWAVVQAYAPTNFRYMFDYFGLALVTIYVIDRVPRLRYLAVVFSIIVLVLVIRNADILTQSERVGVMRAAYFMGDGNDLAWGLVTMLLFPLYLVLGQHPTWLRGFGAIVALLGVGGIIGTQSRGATLALAAGMIVYLVFISKRKAMMLTVMGAVLAGVLILAPSAYFDRMKTLQNVEEDSSAQGRLRAWTAAVSMAIQWPLGVGAGSFNSAFGRYFMPQETGWGMARWISAHSMYFKILGELGFLGLTMLLVVLGSNFFEQLRMHREIASNPAAYDIPEVWPGLLAMGMAGYAVAGTFLGGITYPHLFVLTGLTVACRRSINAAAARVAERVPSAKPLVAAKAAVPLTPAAAFIAELHARHLGTRVR